MMTGYVAHAYPTLRPAKRLYSVVEKPGGWCVSVNGACTRPIADRDAAARIAHRLQMQADALHHASNVAAPVTMRRAN